MDGSINFIPKMNSLKLAAGYKKVLETIYHPKAYYERVKLFLKEYQPHINNSGGLSWQSIIALFKTFWVLGMIEKGKRYYWRLFFLSLFRHPQKFSLAMTLAVYGFHFRQVIKTV